MFDELEVNQDGTPVKQAKNTTQQLEDSMISPLMGASRSTLSSYPTKKRDNPTELSRGARITSLRNSQNEIITYARSTGPLDDAAFDLEWEKVRAINYFHKIAIIGTIVFNLLQNAFALLSTADELSVYIGYKIAQMLAWTCVIIDVPCTGLNNLSARSLKIVELPLILTATQAIFLKAVTSRLTEFKKNKHQHKHQETFLTSQLIALKKQGASLIARSPSQNNETLINALNEINEKAKNLINSANIDQRQKTILHEQWDENEITVNHNFFILVSHEEENEIDANSYFTSENNFDYTLQVVAKTFHTTIHIIPMTAENLQEPDQVFSQLAPNYSLSPYCTLIYSPELYTLKQKSSLTANQTQWDVEAIKPLMLPIEIFSHAMIPDISLYRCLVSPLYRDWIHTKIMYSDLIWNIVGAIPDFLFLILGPFLVTTLQGAATLTSLLENFGLKNLNDCASLTLIFLFGIFIIGAMKAYVTYMIKTPVAIERLHAFYAAVQTWFLTLFVKKNPSNLLENTKNPLRSVCTDFYSILFEQEEYNKKILKLRYHTMPYLHQAIGIWAAMGTTIFYAGLGFFFSETGLIILFNVLKKWGVSSIHPPIENDYSNTPFFSFCLYSCVSTILLNAILNQGYDALQAGWKRANETRNEVQKYLKGEVPLPKEPRGWWDFTLIVCTMVDSLVFATLARTGSSEALKVLTELHYSFAARLQPGLPIAVAVGIYISQMDYSKVLMGKDGKTWGKIIQNSAPTRVRTLFGATTHPSTTAASLLHGFYKPQKDMNNISNETSESDLSTRSPLGAWDARYRY